MVELFFLTILVVLIIGFVIKQTSKDTNNTSSPHKNQRHIYQQSNNQIPASSSGSNHIKSKWEVKTMKNENAIKIWKGTWNQETHETEYALKRIKSAKSAQLTPIELNSADCFGYFQGKHGRYETFLDFCPCGDFRRSKLPCKHIYRLAIELGIMDVEVKRDINAVPTLLPPKNERIKLDKTIDIVESLSENAQRELRKIASKVRSTFPLYPIASNNDNVAELLKSGIISEPDPQNRKPNFGKKAEITALLDAEKIPHNKGHRKAELEEVCLEHIPEQTKERFGELMLITIPPIFSSQKIHYYLHRKFDFEAYYDENVIISEVPLLETELPDDDVTEQLIKRGYYNRANAKTN